MAELIRYKGVMSKVKGEIKTVKRSKRIRTVGKITGDRLMRELTYVGFSREKRFSLQDRLKLLDDLRYMNMRTLAVALLIYDEHPELHPTYNSETKQIIGTGLSPFYTVFNGQVMDRYIGFLYPTQEKLKKRKMISNNDQQALIVRIKADLLRYVFKIAEFLTVGN